MVADEYKIHGRYVYAKDTLPISAVCQLFRIEVAGAGAALTTRWAIK